MRIQHNIMAMNAYRNLNNNNNALSGNLEKLSSGYRINRAGDDAAGLAISEKMRAQITGLDVAQDNAQSGINLIQTAEGALTEVHDMLNRMYELAEQSANGTYDDTDRTQLQKEVAQLQTEIDRIADSANFNGINLLDGGLTNSEAAFNVINNGNTVDLTDGITINAPVDGAGKNQEYTIKFSDLTNFGEGDSVSFDVTDTETGQVTTITATFGNGKFTGTNVEDQLSGLAAELNDQLTAAGADYTAKVTGDATNGFSLKITADTEGEPEITLGNLKVNDDQTKVSMSTSDTGTLVGITDVAGNWDIFKGSNTTTNVLQDGDKLTFGFKVDGKDMTVTLKVGEDIFKNGVPVTDTAEATKQIVEALKNANFDENEDTTLIKEGELKVSDYFDIKANASSNGSAGVTGGIYVTGTNTALGNDTKVDMGTVTISKLGGGDTAISATTSTSATTSGNGASDVEHSITFTFDNSTDGKGMTTGEKFTISGTLADGREFEIELVAGDGTNGTFNPAAEDSVAESIQEYLEAGNGVVTIYDGGVTSIIASDELFTSTATGGFTLGVGKSAGGVTDMLVITNNDAGKVGSGFRAQVTTGGIEKVNKFSGTLEETVRGKEQSQAENVFTLDADKIEQGTIIKIDDKTYEFVTDANNKTHNDNIAVVVGNLGEGATDKDLADALMNSIAGQYTGSTTNPDGSWNLTISGNAYDMKTNNGRLEIVSEQKGDGAVALDAEMGQKKPTSVLEFNTTTTKLQNNQTKVDLHLKVGDTFTIGGKVYEFTDGSRTKDENAIAVNVAGLSKGEATAEDAADALAAAVNQESADNGLDLIARADGGKVVFTSKYDGDAAANLTGYEVDEIEVPIASAELTLQIGDTSANYNQLKVEIKDCHAEAIGVGNIDISTQEGAKTALDEIKKAVNYVSDVRGTLGATQNRLDHTINNLSVMEENIQDAEANIRDTDVAEEMMEYTKNNILIQSAQAMLAQANQVPQGVLQLLG